ncbi:MAG TPA: hypothetical protein PKO07_06770 [Pseudomonadota bacterium]|nr:hypothetical protein [Pseudomonadota bacterium]
MPLAFAAKLRHKLNIMKKISALFLGLLGTASLGAVLCGCSQGGSPPSSTDTGNSDLSVMNSTDGGGTDDMAVAALDLAMPDLSMPDLAIPNDPHIPASCTGAQLNLASKFPMGASYVVLANYTMKYEQRSCTDFTGCGSWGPSTPSWGPSGSGKVYLKVTGTGIIVAVVDNSAGSAYGTPVYNLGMDCALSAGVWNCGRYHDTEIVEGANFLKFEGKDKFSGVELPVFGEVLANCARFYGTVQGVKTAGSYKEYRGGFLLRY